MKRATHENCRLDVKQWKIKFYPFMLKSHLREFISEVGARLY